MVQMTTYVYCTLQAEKLHKWKEAVSEVYYLANMHRHIFHYKVKVEVNHNDREIEFIMLKHKVQKEVASWGKVAGSCEQQAEDLVEYLEGEYPNRNIIVEVSEDGENGAIVERKVK